MNKFLDLLSTETLIAIANDISGCWSVYHLQTDNNILLEGDEDTLIMSRDELLSTIKSWIAENQE